MRHVESIPAKPSTSEEPLTAYSLPCSWTRTEEDGAPGTTWAAPVTEHPTDTVLTLTARQEGSRETEAPAHPAQGHVAH